VAHELIQENLNDYQIGLTATDCMPGYV